MTEGTVARSDTTQCPSKQLPVADLNIVFTDKVELAVERDPEQRKTRRALT
ncbi:MAG: hypothetical protein JO081_16680 [Alphaproteobacteria bacterium]|nr:hypothetical protein [Alphaproteobacteria bacterium]